MYQQKSHIKAYSTYFWKPHARIHMHILQFHWIQAIWLDLSRSFIVALVNKSLLNACKTNIVAGSRSKKWHHGLNVKPKMCYVTQAPHPLHSTPSCSVTSDLVCPPPPPISEMLLFPDRRVVWHFQGLGLLSSTRVSPPLILIKEQFPSGQAEPRWCFLEGC